MSLACRADFAVAVLLLGGLRLFLNHTSLGRAIRAPPKTPDTAELVASTGRAPCTLLQQRSAVAFPLGGAGGHIFSPCARRFLLTPARCSLSCFRGGGDRRDRLTWPGTLVGGIVLGGRANLRAQIHPKRLSYRRPRDVPRRLAGRLTLNANYHSRGGGATVVRPTVMSTDSGFVVERWTRLSAGTSILAAALGCAGVWATAV